jgi:hypothetical protein
MYASSLAELREEMQDADLIQAHDALVTWERYPIGPDYYLTELARRDQERATKIMVEQTQTMVRLTWAIIGLTVVNVAVVIVASIT